MPLDSPDEIERLKRELEEITAERDFLLAENRRLTQTAKDTLDSNRLTGFRSVNDLVPSTNAIQKPVSTPLLNNDSPIIEKIRQF